MSVGCIDRIERHKTHDLFQVFGTAYLSGTYTTGGEFVAAKQLGLSSIRSVRLNNSEDGMIAHPVLTNRGDTCFRLQLFTTKDTPHSGAVTSQVDFTVYGR
jgi:hypothetical protein